MWFMTTLGFFSVVCARRGDGGPGQPVDETRVMIRVRVKGHLDALRLRFPEQLGRVEILETTNSDYRWRLFCPKAVWATCVKALVEDVAYDNFKAECATAHGGGSPYLHALHDTWTTFAKMRDH